MLLRLFFATAVIFTLLDGIVLYLLRNFFGDQVKAVQGTGITLDPVAAALCYLSLVAGLFYFVVIPRKSPAYAFLLGLAVYSVYELTNKAILKRWRWTTAAVDTLWGGTLYALTTLIITMLRNATFS